MSRYEILEHLTNYGPMYIPITSNGEPFYSEGFAIRFFKSDGTEWVANFEPGWTNLKDVIALNNTSNLLVIANGTCYLMNPDNTNPIEAFGVGYSAIFKASRQRYVLQDQTDLTVVEPDGQHWDTVRISWDGLKDIQVDNNIVKGLSFDPMKDPVEWISFTYDIDKKLLIGGSYNTMTTPKTLVEDIVDKKFCELLESKIENVLANSDSEPVKYFWCDGILPPIFEHEYSKKYVNDNRKIIMTAFVGLDGQDKYELILNFGRKALSRYARGLDISECIPDPQNNSWFKIDITQHKIWIQLD